MASIKIDEYGNKFYFDYGGLYHREDGPAMIYANGRLEYAFKDYLHRNGDPAVISQNGNRYWYDHGDDTFDDCPNGLKIHYVDREPVWPDLDKGN